MELRVMSEGGEMLRRCPIAVAISSELMVITNRTRFQYLFVGERYLAGTVHVLERQLSWSTWSRIWHINFRWAMVLYELIIAYALKFPRLLYCSFTREKVQTIL